MVLYNVFSRKATAFHRQAKRFELKFLYKKNFLLEGHTDEIILAASQFACCSAVFETLMIPNNWATIFNVKSNVTHIMYIFLCSMEPAIVVCLVIAFIFWLIRVARIVIHFFKLLEIRAFYKNALRISEVGLVMFK